MVETKETRSFLLADDVRTVLATMKNSMSFLLEDEPPTDLRKRNSRLYPVDRVRSAVDSQVAVLAACRSGTAGCARHVQSLPRSMQRYEAVSSAAP